METNESLSLVPENRVRSLCEVGCSIQVKPNVAARRYFNTGEQLMKRAEMHLQQNELEDAFVYYMRYNTLFVEKIRNHPEFISVPRELKAKATRNLQTTMPHAEQLKTKLLEIYREEYEQYLQEKEKEERGQRQKQEEEEEKQRRLLSMKSTQSAHLEEIRKNTSHMNVVKPVYYLPDDFVMYDIPKSDAVSEPVTISSAVTKPGIDRSTKPIQRVTYSDKLRTIIVPSSLMTLFLDLAHGNTRNNVETCGILAGKLQYNRFVITHLLIPKQYGSPDSCTTDNEEDLFNYLSKHDLITVGWIHTHPSQTAFLSSVDLHTHYSYQLMMSEAIAIVCAPRYSQTGFFQLTPNYGLNYIGNCHEKGFHPHPSDPPLFQEAEHCQQDENARVEVKDLRI